MMLWLYVHFPNLQLDSLYQDDDIIDPIIIINTASNKIEQCNDAAKQHGITTGMGLGSAASLCPHLQVIEYQQEIEEKLLKQLAQCCYQHMADIALQPPQGLLFRITPMLRLYHDVARCWHAIEASIKQVTVCYSVATAYSPMAAQLLAQQQAINSQNTNLGNVCIALETKTDDIDKQLINVAITTTTLPATVCLKLSHLGINQLGGLLKIPLKELAQRFDIEVVNTLGKIKGELKTQLDFYRPPQHFSYHLTLNFEIKNTQVIIKPIRYLFNKLMDYLITRELVACQISLQLIDRDGAHQLIEINTTQGEQQSSKLMPLVALQLERITLQAPVIALTLESVLLLNKQTTSGELFSPTVTTSNKLSAAQLINLLQAKLGSDAVHGLRLNGEHSPEFASQQRALNLFDSTTSMALSAPAKKHRIPAPTLLRPSYLLATPQPWFDPVTIIHGPERIQTNWWQHQELIRDYYIAKNKQQQWCWLFKQPNGQWFIHGYFG